MSFLTRGVTDKNYYNASFISDLGLRRSDEPTKFFMNNPINLLHNDEQFIYGDKFHDQTVVNIFNKLNRPLDTSPFNFEEFVSSHIQTPDRLNVTLKYYADVLGNWIDADRMANLILNRKEIIPDNDQGAELLSSCGNLLAHTGDPRCRDAYNLALEIWENPYQKFTTQFRIAVAEIKRLNQPKAIPEAIKKSYQAAIEFGNRTKNSSDTKFSKGLIKNLEALFYIKSKQLDKAGESIKEALDLISDIPSSNLTIIPGISYRYRLQILENYGLYAGMTSSWKDALPIYRQALTMSREHHPESLAEVLAMYGYALIQAKESREAIEVLLEAEELFSQDIWIDKVPQIHKMLAVAYDDIGNNERSLFWLEKLMNQSELTPTL